MGIRVRVYGCDDSTDFNLVCTEEQFAFLREFAKTTKLVSDCKCMPTIKLFNEGSEIDKTVSLNSVNLKLVEGKDKYGDTKLYQELDTTNI